MTLLEAPCGRGLRGIIPIPTCLLKGRRGYFAGQPRAGEALLGFGSCGEATLNLSPAGDLDEAAANLYAMLHALDRAEFSAIAVTKIPHEGAGAAINDRLRRGAAAATVQSQQAHG